MTEIATTPEDIAARVIKAYRRRWLRWFFSRTWRDMASIDAAHQSRMYSQEMDRRKLQAKIDAKYPPKHRAAH